jgi:hypothetical protein
MGEELERLPGILTPHGHAGVARLARWMPFEIAAELFAARLLMTISVSKSLNLR